VIGKLGHKDFYMCHLKGNTKFVLLYCRHLILQLIGK